MTLVWRREILAPDPSRYLGVRPGQRHDAATLPKDRLNALESTTQKAGLNLLVYCGEVNNTKVIGP